MKKVLMMLVTALAVGFAGTAHATPSTQIWIPSTDIQGFGVFHFGLDSYNNLGEKSIANGGKGFNVVNYGLTVGILPASVTELVGIEVGVDYRDISGDTDNPTYLNAKIGVPESAFGLAVAVGGYDFGGKKDVNDYNIMYGLVAKSFEGIGRFSIGGYSGNDKLLLDDTGKKDATGVLASRDKALNDKWWAAIDYMGGKNAYGALSFGVSYMVGENSSFIIGYDIYNNDVFAKPTLTFQFDHNF